MRLNKPLIFITAFISLGILSAGIIQASYLIPLAVLVILAAACFFCIKKSGYDMLFFVLFFTAGFTAMSFHNSWFPANHARRIISNPGDVRAVAIFVSEVPKESRLKYYFTGEIRGAETKNIKYSNLTGLIRCTIKKKYGKKIKYGDILRIESKVEMPQAGAEAKGFDYAAWLNLRRIYFTLYASDLSVFHQGREKRNILYYVSSAIKEKLVEIIYRSVPKDRAVILEGIMLGNQKIIPKYIYEMFKRTGTVHILAVSGMNVGLIAFFTFLMLKLMKIRRKAAALITMAFITFFAVVTGADASILRATVMGYAVLLAIILERDADILNSLAAAAFVIILVKPVQLFDVGFQLSFLATFGLIYLTGYFERLVPWIPKPLALIIISTITAQVFIAPVLINTFHRLSLISVIANIFVVPLSSVITILGFVMWGLGIISGWAAQAAGASIWVLINVMMYITEILSKIPFAAIEIQRLPVLFVVMYTMFFLALPHADIEVYMGKLRLKPVLGAISGIWGLIHILI